MEPQVDWMELSDEAFCVYEAVQQLEGVDNNRQGLAAAEEDHHAHSHILQVRLGKAAYAAQLMEKGVMPCGS